MTERTRRKLISLVMILAWMPSMVPAAFAQASAPAAASPEAGWPRQIDANGAVVLVYQPQIDKWQGNRLEARAAVSARPPGAAAPFYGVIWITARTEVDKERGLVSLEDIAIPRVSFPSAPQKTQDYLRFARQHVPAGVRTVPLAELEANLAATRAQSSTGGVAVNNDPPRIIVSTVPAVMVRIDGQPSLRQAPGSTLLRVINTRALVLLDPSTGYYYLSAAGRWLQAAAIDGPWTPAATPPAALEEAKRAAVAGGQVDLLDGVATASPPAVYVSTGPAELIVLTGAPTWTPIPGTELLYATNTQARVFLELKAQNTFVLLSGRWFRARTLDGPWSYVPGAQLPPDFAKIPADGPTGAVLASVPGTSQAQEAVIAASIPQTATVTRSQATFTATYDGSPQWRPITGTPLQYAANSPTPIIRIDAKTYYSLYNGVWFTSATPQGPWVVAAVVPAVIYTIPVTSPLHYVTHVRVYGATPTVVYVGYTPGYLGTVVSSEGVLVYGTGVVYTPWVGTVWYPPPPTYGYGAGFAWGATTGFVMGAAVGAAAWGCCGSSSTANINVNKTTYNYNNSNVYNSWSKTTVSSGDKSATVYQGPNTKVATNNQNNNVYASHDGNVYKKQDGQWEKWDGSGNGWQPVNTSSSKTTQSSPSSSSSRQNPGAQQTGGQQSAQPRAQQQQASGHQTEGQQSTGQQRGEQRTGQQAGGQQSIGQEASERGQQREGQGMQPGQSLGSSRQQGAGQGVGGQRGLGGQGSQRSQGFQGLGQRSGGGGSDLLGGLDREEMGRARGFQRLSGGGHAGGSFRR